MSELKSKHKRKFQEIDVNTIEAKVPSKEVTARVNELAFEAVGNKSITDYKLYLPFLDYDDVSFLKYIDSQIEMSSWVDDKTKIKCFYFLQCLLDHGKQKCIFFCENVTQIAIFRICIRKIMDHHKLNIWYNSIALNKEKNNLDSIQKKIRKFSKNKIPSILLALNDFAGFIKIPECDSVVIAFPPSDQVDIIPMMTCSMVLNSNTVDKLPHIYLWYEKFEIIIPALLNLFDHDTNLLNKINIKLQSGDIYLTDLMINKMGSNLDKIKKDLMNFITTTSYEESESKEEKKVRTRPKKEFPMKEKLWDKNLEMLMAFIDKNKVKPSPRSPDSESKKLGIWTSTQKAYYKRNKFGIMNRNILKKWLNFIKKYRAYYRTYFLKTVSGIDSEETETDEENHWV